jgi:hypothetical protein
MRTNIKAVVCPDIHGRSFWKNAADEYDGSVPFIFLGDYLDPYNDEGITVEEAKSNFEDIWRFKEKWGDNVILLLGNHDLSYKDYMFQCCRFSMYSSGWYKDFLNEHWEHFNLSYDIKADDKTFIFSHAGIHPSWLKENNFEEIYDADYINSLFMTNKRAFTDYSVYRGGYLSAGSPVWADIREFSKVDLQDDKIMQVVGHTQLIKDKLEFKNICCIDSRQTFVITNDNKIEKYLVNDI